ncbi:MAG: aminotransferase class I/II-fold pyridoxal phosphate-dependent enzyme [Fluviibacter sp.]
MTEDQFASLCVLSNLSIQEALAVLDNTACGVLLVIKEDGTLLRTITDGDLRRAALAGTSVLSAVSQLPAHIPLHVSDRASAQDALALMNKHQIDHVPVLNSQGYVVDLLTRRDITQRIWMSSPHLGEEESAFVEEAFRTNWVAPLGPHVDAFERELAACVGVGHAAAVSSGTAAIHLGLILLGVKPNDTVFCSSLTFVASANPINYCAAKPVFIDSEPQTWNMSPSALESAFEWAKRKNRLPKCVVIVNLYGQSADMDALLPICEHYGVPVLEDAAESLGARYRGRASGSFGHVAIYSFNGNKIITTSGGGMLVSDDPELMARARKLATQAREPAAHYEHVETGFNYRMSNVLAGIGRGQLKVLDDRVRARRRIFEIYREALAECVDIALMPEPEGHYATRWLTCFALEGPDAATRCKNIIYGLERHAIECRPVWKPMHLQQLFKNAPYFRHSAAEDVSASLFERGICLPSGSNLRDEDIDRVITQLKRALQ